MLEYLSLPHHLATVKALIPCITASSSYCPSLVSMMRLLGAPYWVFCWRNSLLQRAKDTMKWYRSCNCELKLKVISRATFGSSKLYPSQILPECVGFVCIPSKIQERIFHVPTTMCRNWTCTQARFRKTSFHNCVWINRRSGIKTTCRMQC